MDETSTFQTVESEVPESLGQHFDSIGFDPIIAGRTLQAVANVGGLGTRGDLRAQEWIAKQYLALIQKCLADKAMPAPDSDVWKK